MRKLKVGKPDKMTATDYPIIPLLYEGGNGEGPGHILATRPGAQKEAEEIVAAVNSRVGSSLPPPSIEHGGDKSWALSAAAVSYRRYGRYSEGSAPQGTNSIRVFRISPDRVAIQVRAGKGFATASVPLDVAQAFAFAILDATREG